MIQNLCVKVFSGVASELLSRHKTMTIINQLYTSLYNICDEIKSAKLDVVKSSFENIFISRNPTTIQDEVNKAISVLEDAYELSYHMYKTYVIPKIHREKWHEGLVDMAALMYLLYKFKGENEILNKWIGNANQVWESYVDKYLQLTPYDLYRISDKYAYSTEDEEWETVEYNEFLSKMEKTTKTVWHITDEGYTYIRNHNAQLLSEFNEGLRKMQLLDYSMP